ncbi:MAG: serine hydrolase [Actinomycetota bacterium]|nr:serine hydrolase [Actinomycetota bacterium]
MDRHPDPPEVEEALKVEGARVTLPVSAAITKDVFTPKFIRVARKNWSNFHFQMAGDHALYYALHLAEFMPSTEASPNINYQALKRDLRPELLYLTQSTSGGGLTLQEYMINPLYRAQSMIMVHKGKVVYENYPGMRPTDRHLTASTAKITVGGVLLQLIAEGKIDLRKPITEYVPELKDTVWDDVTTYAVANMTTGLDNEETVKALLQPDSPVTRFLAATAGSPRATTGVVEDWIDVARDQKKLGSREKPGDVMRYASLNTTVLTRLIENIENKPFVEVFEERFWSKLYARQSMMFGLAPDGTALPVGFAMASPEDYAKFGVMFTPSWKAVASERVVTDEMMKILYDNVDKERYAKGAKIKMSEVDFNEAAQGNAIQFDYIWDDGAIAKSGNMMQMIYIDPERDFVSVYFSTTPFVEGYGEFKAGAYQRAAAKLLHGE